MTKSAKSEIIEFPAFDAAEVTDQFRAYAEKGVEQSKEIYAKVKDVTEEAQKAIEDTFEQGKEHGTALSLKAINVARANAEAGFSQLEALAKVKTLSEFVELQSTFFSKQMETFADQAKDMQVLATKAMEDAAKPVKGAIEKAMTSVKAA